VQSGVSRVLSRLPSPFGGGPGRLCAVLAAPTARVLQSQFEAALQQTPTIELRLDWLRSDAERRKFLAWLRTQTFRGATLIATCRRTEGGGRLSGGIPHELFWLMEARAAGCTWCDIEMETFRELPQQSVRDYAVPSKIMLSIHDFDRTPPLPGTVEVARHGQVDAVKIAAFARSYSDALRLLAPAKKSRSFVAVPMGELALPLRILALRAGSALAYAPVGKATAPGQVSLAQMQKLYRADHLDDATKVYGVIGDPVGHSLSPVLHNTAFIARRINAVYLPFLVPDLGEFLKAVPAIGLRGFSVTLPHKETILTYLKSCDPLAAEIGAVNTVTVRADGSLHGSNSDYLGVLHSLASRMKLRGSRVLIFGAGGSARAAAFALARSGALVAICARRESAARQLARACGGEALPRKALRSERFDAMLNATPIGMHPHAAVSPLTAAELHCRVVMDLIYRPQRTALLKIAAQKHMATVSGVDMFVAQGVAQWEMWIRKTAPVAKMRAAVLAALRSEARQ
jgi:3-dehydroquinate dehydratase / shikimate dehydrogenase